jgi:hypothetical protein
VALARTTDEEYDSRVDRRTQDKLLDAMGRTALVLQFTPDTRARLWQEFSRQLHAVQLAADEGA